MGNSTFERLFGKGYAINEKRLEQKQHKKSTYFSRCFFKNIGGR